VAVSRGAIVYPYPTRDTSLITFASSVGAEIAGHRKEGGYSLSPASLLHIPAGTGLVLPSPNGAALSLSTGNALTLAGCFRNASAVATAAMKFGNRIAVIPAGEKWQEDGSLRPSIEDLLGAGAIINCLSGKLSPEAQLAAQAFSSSQNDLFNILFNSCSGKELQAMGYPEDIRLCSEINADDCSPTLVNGAYKSL
jgi:2-phosphosulfolactate phosphatase